MELPFTIVFEPPSHEELRAVVRLRGYWVAGLTVALAIGTVLLVSTVGHADSSANGATAPLELRSQPAGALASLDGRELGRTPLAATVPPGAHAVVLKSPGSVDAHYTVQLDPSGVQLNAVLWSRQPSLLRLRPALPGAILNDVRLLGDGRLALSVGLPSGQQVQAWRLSPSGGALEPLLTGVMGERITVARDGQHVAYLGPDVGPAGPPLSVSGRRTSVVWHVDLDAPDNSAGWRAPLDPDAQLRDVSWSPSADWLLVVASQQNASGFTRSRLWFVDAISHDAREVLSLPSEVVTGSELWSPDGTRVAFVARAASLNALCLLDRDGRFGYLADLEPSTAPPLLSPAAAWSDDSQQLLFVAPRQRPPGASNTWLQSDARRTLYVASTIGVAPLRLGDTDVDRVAWREDGEMLGLGRQANDGTLDLRLVASPTSGGSQHLLDLPLRPTAGFASAWDVPHARLLIAMPSAAGGVEYWLALLGSEAEQ